MEPRRAQPDRAASRSWTVRGHQVSYSSNTGSFPGIVAAAIVAAVLFVIGGGGLWPILALVLALYGLAAFSEGTRAARSGGSSGKRGKPYRGRSQMTGELDELILWSTETIVDQVGQIVGTLFRSLAGLGRYIRGSGGTERHQGVRDPRPGNCCCTSRNETCPQCGRPARRNRRRRRR